MCNGVAGGEGGFGSSSPPPLSSGHMMATMLEPPAPIELWSYDGYHARA